MAPGFHFSWFLVAWLVVAVAEGQDVVTPPGGSQNNMNPTDCQIITLTPPPTTPTMRAQPITRTPTVYFPPRRPGFYPRFPNTPLFLPNNRRFQFWPLYPPPRGRLIPWRVFFGRRLQSGSSSEESAEK